jgi:hypothetical protein
MHGAAFLLHGHVLSVSLMGGGSDWSTLCNLVLLTHFAFRLGSWSFTLFGLGIHEILRFGLSNLWS